MTLPRIATPADILASLGYTPLPDNGVSSITAAQAGILADGYPRADFITTTGSNQVGCAGYNFASHDIGKLLTVDGAGATVTLAGNTTSGSNQISGLSSNTTIPFGNRVTGAGVPSGIVLAAAASTGSNIFMGIVTPYGGQPSNAAAISSNTGSNYSFSQPLCGVISSVISGKAVLTALNGLPAIAGMTLTGATGTFGTDDLPAWTALAPLLNPGVKALTGGGTVVLAPNRGGSIAQSLVSGRIPWYSGMGLRGAGAGVSIIKGIGYPAAYVNGDGQHIGIIGNPQDNGTPATPWVNMSFRDVEVDGSSLVVPAGDMNSAYKGISLTYAVGSYFENVYVHDTPKTGIACDWGQSVFANCEIDGCGRCSMIAWPGSSGIGNSVNKGATWQDITTIIGGKYQDNKNFGMFAESASTTTVAANSAWRIVGPYIHCSSNSWGAIGLCGDSKPIVSDVRAIYDTSLGSSALPYTFNGGVIINGGTVATDPSEAVHLVNSQFTGFYFQVVLDYTNHVDGNPAEINIQGCTFTDGLSTGRGISVATGSASVVRLRIHDTHINRCGSAFACTGAGTISQLDIQDCDWSNNIFGYHGAGPAVTGQIKNCDLSSNSSGGYVISSGSFTGPVVGNLGYNPLGPSAVTVTGSPMTLTASNSPTDFYINGGTVSSVTKGGVTLATATNCRISLDPGASAVITYSSAPTIVGDVH